MPLLKRTNVAQLLVAACGMLAALTPCPAAPRAGDEFADALRQLGSPDPGERLRAEHLLWSAGDRAETTLQAAARSGDPEVAVRAARLLREVRDGIGPDTPQEVAALARSFRAATTA